MRVCQPFPVALKAAITSGDRRMVVACLVGGLEEPHIGKRFPEDDLQYVENLGLICPHPLK